MGEAGGGREGDPGAGRQLCELLDRRLLQEVQVRIAFQPLVSAGSAKFSCFQRKTGAGVSEWWLVPAECLPKCSGRARGTLLLRRRAGKGHLQCGPNSGGPEPPLATSQHPVWRTRRQGVDGGGLLACPLVAAAGACPWVTHPCLAARLKPAGQLLELVEGGCWIWAQQGRKGLNPSVRTEGKQSKGVNPAEVNGTHNLHLL